MKTSAIVLLALLAACPGSVAQNETQAKALAQAQAPKSKSTHTGKAVIAGLGTIVFPEGEWALEHQRLHPAPVDDRQVPDYFVFKRVGTRLERLTFLRYPPTTPPRQLGFMLDTVAETMGDGLPWELKDAASRGRGVIHHLKVVPQAPAATAKHVAFSFIHVPESPAPPWLCHAVLFLQDSAAYIIAHASTSVPSPEAVQDVQFDSDFSRGGKATARTPADK